MILVTGGTGFIGKALVRHLVENDHPVRLLIRPSRQSPDIPRGTPVEVAVSSLSDERGLRSAMSGVKTVYHLASMEWSGLRARLLEVDVQGTQAVIRAAADAGVKRIFFLSHLGADRASAFPLLKAKAIAEEHIRRSGLDYTILRSGIVFGLNDHFMSGLARLIAALPLIFLIPGDGNNLLQPLWVEDLVTCLVWALDDEKTCNQTYSIGGPEFLTFNSIVKTVMETIGAQRQLVYADLPYIRALTAFLEPIFPTLPTTVFWLDYLASNHTCALDTIPRVFNLLPSRFTHRLDYLKNQTWRTSFFKRMLRRGM